MRKFAVPLLVLTMMASGTFANDPPANDPPANEVPVGEFAQERAMLVREIETDVRATASYLGRDKLNPRVIKAMRSVPRHKFVPEEARLVAYQNRPLSIGHGQTISQPYIVAIMTDLLDLDVNARVLEVGTGSGYQAAVLAEVCDTVYTVEIVEPLGKEAEAALKELGYINIRTRIGDGYAGWPEHAPFDGILVTAAAPYVPEPLIEQLRPGGRMIIPVKQGMFAQELVLVEKAEDGSVKRTNMLPVRFVPLTR